MQKVLSLNMNKRGQAEVVGVIFLIGLVVIGGISGHKIISENRYVGDKSTMLYYDLKKCDIDNLQKENLINFKNFDEVKQSKFNPAKCSIS